MKYRILPQHLMLLGCLLIAVGMPGDGFMRAFENVGLMGILLVALWYRDSHGKQRLLQPLSICLMLLLGLVAFDYFFTINLSELNRKMALKVLFLLFPLGFSFAPIPNQAIRRYSLLAFASLTAFLALLSCIRYAMHYTEYNLLVQQSKPIEIVGGTMHIYFSVMMALSVLIGTTTLFADGKLKLTNYPDRILGVSIMINFLALHMLSARTGLFAFYGSVGVMLFYYAIKNKKYKILGLGLLSMLVFPMLMYVTLPSVKNRINNTIDDMSRYFRGDYVGYYSISGRFETWKTAGHIFMEHPWFGIGAGDLQDAIELQLKVDNTRLMREEALPNCHNQYIEILATHGIPGILIFLGLLGILWNKTSHQKHRYLWLALVSVFFFSFMVESLLERQAGITLFLFFLFLFDEEGDAPLSMQPTS